MILGLDISSSCIGYSIFDMDGKLIELNCVKFRDKLTLFEKLEEFKKSTEHFKKLEIQFIAIEEPLKKFMGKFSSASTIALLNFFNGMISSYLYVEFGIEPIYFNVNNARSLVFPKSKKTAVKKTDIESAEDLEVEVEQEEKGSIKHEIFKKVMALEPLINWRYGPKSRKLLDENYDMCDSYVIGVAMLITLDKQTKTA